jgi:hypothetical protein
LHCRHIVERPMQHVSSLNADHVVLSFKVPSTMDLIIKKVQSNLACTGVPNLISLLARISSTSMFWPSCNSCWSYFSHLDETISRWGLMQRRRRWTDVKLKDWK